MNRVARTIAGASVLILLAVAVAAAAGRDTIGYQGRLLDGSGAPVTATVTLTFSIYDSDSAPVALWTETQNEVPVSQGIFHVQLGSVTAFPPHLFDGPDRWLGVKAGADAEMSPRTRLTSVGFAVNSQRVAGKRVETGTGTLNVNAGANQATADLVYPAGAFTGSPTVTVSGLNGQIGGASFVATEITNQSNTGCTIVFRAVSGTASAAGSAGFGWIAVGP